MDDKQELEYLRKWHRNETQQYTFNYILTLASIVTALTSLLAIIKSYDLFKEGVIQIVLGVILTLCAFLLILAFVSNFLTMNRR